VPASASNYISRRIAHDVSGDFGGQIAVSTDIFTADIGQIDLVDPVTGALDPLALNFMRPNLIAFPAPASAYTAGLYYFQQWDFPAPDHPASSRKVYRLDPGVDYVGDGTPASVGTQFETNGMDAGSGLIFAPDSFGSLGGQLFGSDSGNAPGSTSGDGVRRWDSAGTFTNEIMGNTANNPDTFADLTFTGEEFGAFSNRLVVANTTGINGRNLFTWTAASIEGNVDPLSTYWSYALFHVVSNPGDAGQYMRRVTYGAYGEKGVLFGATQGSVYRFNANQSKQEFLSASPGFNDIEFSGNRTLFVADLYSGLYRVDPSPARFATFLSTRRCAAAAPLAATVSEWTVGGECPGAAALCALADSCGRTCFSSTEQKIITDAVQAICELDCSDALE